MAAPIAVLAFAKVVLATQIDLPHPVVKNTCTCNSSSEKGFHNITPLRLQSGD